MNLQKNLKQDYGTYTIPKGVKIIGANAFYNCLISHIIVPDTVETIEKKAFNQMPLDVLELPATVCNIDTDLFGDDSDCGDDCIIKAPAGSYAIQYAKENSIEYEEV